MKYLKFFLYGTAANLVIPFLLMLLPAFLLGDTALIETLSDKLMSFTDSIK